MRPLRIQAEALQELDSAITHYESDYAGRGERFERAGRNTLAEIQNDPNKFPLVEGKDREAFVSGLPYCVYYREQRSCIAILSAFHQARQPGGCRGRG